MSACHGLSLIHILLLTLFVLFGSIDFVYANTRELDLIGKSAILIDATTGEILYEKNIHDKHYPASTTKIMTAILALENLDLSELSLIHILIRANSLERWLISITDMPLPR